MRMMMMQQGDIIPLDAERKGNSHGFKQSNHQASNRAKQQMMWIKARRGEAEAAPGQGIISLRSTQLQRIGRQEIKPQHFLT